MPSQGVRHEFIQGESFPSMDALKTEVARYFAERNLAFRLTVNNRTRLKVQCVDHRECPIVLRACKVRNSDTVKITSVYNGHSTELIDVKSSRLRAPNRVRGKLLVPVAQEAIQLSSNDASSDVIIKKARLDHRLAANRGQAWRAKQKVLSVSIEQGNESYKFLQDWLVKMQEENPGTAIRFETANSRFQRCALVHGGFDTVVDSMVPVLALDACHLKTKHRGTLYLASLFTGNFDVFIVGMAISNCAERENKRDWNWFLQAVGDALPTLLKTEGLVVSDRDKGLIPSVAEVLPMAHHAYCCVHIKRNVASRFGTGLGGTVHLIARAVLKTEADSLLSELGAVRPDIAEYLLGIDKSS